MLSGGMFHVFKCLQTFEHSQDILIGDETLHSIDAKDILAFTIAHSAFCDEAHIFGGFLCSIYSGLEYDDLDILFDSRKAAISFMRKIPSILELFLGLEFHDFEITLKKKEYCSSLHVTAKIGKVMTQLTIDIVNSEECSPQFQGGGVFFPVTWGRMLKYRPRNGLNWRIQSPIKNYCKIPSIDYIKHNLSQSKDILNTSISCGGWNKKKIQLFEEYFRLKIEKMKKQGYVISGNYDAYIKNVFN